MRCLTSGVVFVADKSKMGLCPCCGGKFVLPRQATYNPQSWVLSGVGYRIEFTAQEARVFGLLWEGWLKGEVASREQLVNVVYHSDPEGGPRARLDSEVVNTVIWRVRKRLREAGVTGMRVVNIRGGGFFLGIDHEDAA